MDKKTNPPKVGQFATWIVRYADGKIRTGEYVKVVEVYATMALIRVCGTNDTFRVMIQDLHYNSCYN